LAAVNRDRLQDLLESVQKGDTAPAEALERIARLPFVDTEHARVDTHRAIRHGIPEVVFAAGKRPEQVVSIVRALREAEQDVIVTRLEEDAATTVLRDLGEGRYETESRVAWFGPETPRAQGKGTIAVVSAGTSDWPAAAEATTVARLLGNPVEVLQDVGVAGIHRLLSQSEVLRSARVLIVVAGMEGALPSVVGGLVDKPVIAVPTSVGYGAAFSGIAALLGMLTSCASNVTVVNIDNGFGAAYVASLINRL
jgi:NCAIR mutase (PurE)-related protein